MSPRFIPRPNFAARAAILVVLVCAVGAGPAGARTFYVAPWGSDHRSGRNPAAAWASVQRVDRARLRAGDKVFFRGGETYGDAVLMPGWGTDASGTRTEPITFSSYGGGRAWIRQGVWFRGESHLVFEDLDLSTAGLSGDGRAITVQEDRIDDITGEGRFAINARGSYWAIEENTVSRVGDSGIQVNGSHYLLVGNHIDGTGLDPAVTWGAHGIYLKASDCRVEDNAITNFRNEGISARYRNTDIRHNFISGGQYGIGWHQYDTRSGTSYWQGNYINETTVVGIYVSPHDLGGPDHEHFVITGNTVVPARGLAVDLRSRKADYRPGPS